MSVMTESESGDWGDTKVCPWKARDALDEFYDWSTGAYSQLPVASLADSAGANAITIDEPLIVQWSVPPGTTSNSGAQASFTLNCGRVELVSAKANYTCAKMFLRYEGSGRLYGFPEFCVVRRRHTIAWSLNCIY